VKKKSLLALFALTLCVATAACGGETPENNITDVLKPIEVIESEYVPSSEQVESKTEEVIASSVEESVEEPDIPPAEGLYRSELTNEWIDEVYKNQRPVAVMVDNESKALPHYGVNSADIVYEMMNSTANGRVTRLMVIKKDYQNITQFGSIRSVRPTNFMLAVEYNAVLLHDGGPFYIDEYLTRPYNANISGGFARYSNGKASEFTEYVTYEDYQNPTTGAKYPGLKKRIANAGLDMNYNEYYTGPHFKFSNKEYDLGNMADVIVASQVELPFPHNGSKLYYNADSKTYDYYEYGQYHVDPLDDNKVTTFKNLIIQSCDFYEYDKNGYMVYNVVGSGEDGWFVTNGKAIPITWSKESEEAQTVYKVKATGEEIVLNTGTTYVAIVPSDGWKDLEIK